MFDWADYLVVARMLDSLNTLPIEATRRAVVSRAYYAAFGHARRYTVQYLGNTSLPGADEHARLVRYLRRQRYRKVADTLEDLRAWRNQCDYDDSVPQLEEKTRSALTDATYVIETLVFY